MRLNFTKSVLTEIFTYSTESTPTEIEFGRVDPNQNSAEFDQVDLVQNSVGHDRSQSSPFHAEIWSSWARKQICEV